MIKPEYLELIHKEIDNEISPENRDKLQAYLAKHQEAETFYRELIHSSKLLASIPEIEVPPELSTRILNSLNYNRYSKKENGFPNPIKILDWFLKPTPKPAYAFALGLILGLIVYAGIIMIIFKEQPIDLADVYGTISTMDNNRMEYISTHPIDLPDMKGNINLRKLANTILFEINIQPSKTFILEMEFEKDQLNFSAYRPLSPVLTEFENRESMIRLSSSEDVTFVLFFKKIQETVSPIELSIETAGVTIFRHNFLIKK